MRVVDRSEWLEDCDWLLDINLRYFGYSSSEKPSILTILTGKPCTFSSNKSTEDDYFVLVDRIDLK